MRCQLWLVCLLMLPGCDPSPNQDGPPEGYISLAEYDKLQENFDTLHEDFKSAGSRQKDAESKLAAVGKQLADARAELAEKKQDFDQLYAVYEKTLSAYDSQAEELQSARKKSRPIRSKPRSKSTPQTKWISDNIKLVSHTQVGGSQGRIVGEIENVGGEAYAIVSLKITFYDSQGRLLDTRDAIASSLQPGEKAAFEAWLTGLQYDHYVIRLASAI